MNPKIIKTTKVGKEKADVFWTRAAEYYNSMVDAAISENWNSVGLLAIHCIIAASDALLVKHAGLRSISKSHEDVADLIGQHISVDTAKEQARRDQPPVPTTP